MGRHSMVTTFPGSESAFAPAVGGAAANESTQDFEPVDAGVVGTANSKDVVVDTAVPYSVPHAVDSVRNGNADWPSKTVLTVGSCRDQDQDRDRDHSLDLDYLAVDNLHEQHVGPSRSCSSRYEWTEKTPDASEQAAFRVSTNRTASVVEAGAV